MLDTNVVLDMLAEREPFRRTASLIKALGFVGEIEVWVSAKSFTDIFYIMRKNFTSETIQELFLENLLAVKVCSIDGDDIRTASKRSWPDFEDCLVSIAAEKVKADYLVTRDRLGFAQAKTAVCSPDEFFDMLERDHGLSYEEIDF
ncbi:PIN domain-containing protein [Raoultibacter phocaeensis]|uniref:PIN domain-containing protein n=1 Tax=Raoultibacter phocaeensis TaxID=2479841 RepID=UPI0015D5D072|nr:PIN domain-containing protein [Raoultibacter phocaeensis]